MAVVMAVRGRFREKFGGVVGRISARTDVRVPADTILVCRDGPLPDSDMSGFAAVLVKGGVDAEISGRVGFFENLDNLMPGDLVAIDGQEGRVRTVYRAGSQHNALFTTDRCNSNCLMCSQPPKETGEDRLSTCLRVVELLREAPPSRLGITGGEPTLLGDGFVGLLQTLKNDLPETTITALTNGRTFADARFVQAIAEVAHAKLRFSIPLHADVPDVHDYIAQSKGAFVETLAGLYNLAEQGIAAEIRIVLHALSVSRLSRLAEFIYRKLPFVQQVAFMGLENMGYVKKNWGLLWIDPIDYAGDLAAAVSHLFRRGMAPAIYNLPLCVVPPPLWAFARQSISDHKQTLVSECDGCQVAEHCAGFFTSGTERRSIGVQAINLPEETGGTVFVDKRGAALPVYR
jgi:His-Xaa-Ser system radical SAM maturase HxsC